MRVFNNYLFALAGVNQCQVGLCKRRGFVFPSSDIYNGFNGFYDYGPLGVELKNNIKQNWWKHFVHGREDMVRESGGVVLLTLCLYIRACTCLWIAENGRLAWCF